MQILQLLESWGPGGAERMVLSLSAELQRRGHQVAIVLPSSGWVTSTAARLGIECIVTPTRKGAFDAGLLRQLRDIVRGRDADVVHCQMEGMASYSVLASVGRRCRRIVTLHGPGHMSRRERWTDAAHRLLAARAFDRIVCVSESLRRRVAACGVPEAKLEVVQNWLFEGERETPAGTQELPARTSGRVRVVAVGNYRPEKDYPVLLEAFRQVVDTGCDVELVVAGAFPSDRERRHYPALVKDAGLGDRVRLLEYVHDLRALLATADIYVSSSYIEGFSLTILEAMSAGLPVVATRSGGADDLVRDGIDGLLVPPRDPQMLAEALARLVNDPVRRGELARASAALASAWPTVERQADRYEVLYAAGA
jgi:glycosyltransferase involved in cell wall biosynthesis